MPSGLGDTVSPSGESGEVGRVQSPPSQIHDAPQQIVATTAVESLEYLLYRDWIWHNTYTIDTGMAAGHVVAVLPNHPSACNQYVAHVAQMFNAWNGGFKLRARFMATAFYGGSFRIGFLPPNISETDIRKMSVKTLTAYPNQDLDPKNTGWLTYECFDERNSLFHWGMTYDNLKRESFGGYAVIYVAAPLVTQDSSIHSISLLVETAGNYVFAQPNPLFGGGISPGPGPTPSGGGLLPNWLLTNLLAHPGGDSRCCSRSRVLSVFPGNWKQFGDGFYTIATATGWDLHMFPNIHIVEMQQIRDKAILARKGKFDQDYGRLVTLHKAYRKGDRNNDGLIRLMTQNYRVDDVNPFGIGLHEKAISTSFVAEDKGDDYVYNYKGWFKQLHEKGKWMSVIYEKKGGTLRYNMPGVGCETICWDHPDEDYVMTPLDVPARYFHGIDGYEYEPGSDWIEDYVESPRADEQLVCWQDLGSGASDFHSLTITQWLSENFDKKTNLSTTWVYALRTTSNDVILTYFRYHPCGLFTTYRGHDGVVFPDPYPFSYYLTFEMELPGSSPLPKLTNSASVKLRRLEAVSSHPEVLEKAKDIILY